MDLIFSDVDSFSESSSSEDQDDVEILYDGHACSILSSLEETLGKIDDFLSFERGFMHGDVVCSVKDPSGQMGKVINVDINVDLENIHGGKIQDVNSKNLKRIRSISVGDYVVKGTWLGKVEKIVDRISVLFDDGTKSEFTSSGSDNLVPVSPDLLEDSQYPFYPGQRVQVNSSSASKSTNWLCCTKKDNRNQGTVCSVDAGLLYVDWTGSAMVDSEKVSTPSCLQDSEDITLLSFFSHASWQLGDWCLLPLIDCKNTEGHNFLSAPVSGLIKDEEQSGRVFKRGNLTHIQEIAVIVKMKTKVDVLWQDGSYSTGLDSQSLLPVSIIDAHDFWPEQFVLEKGMCDDPPVSCNQRWGTVKYVDAKERTVKVKWSTFVMDQSTHFMLKQMEEVVSAYELVEHPDYSYCLGDAVFRLHKCHLQNQSNKEDSKNYLISKRCTCEELDLKNTGNEKDLTVYSRNDMLSSIGIVVGLNDGDIEVKWASGMINKVAPYEIYRVESFEGLSATTTPSTANAEHPNEGMPVLENLFAEPTGKMKPGFESHAEDIDKTFWGSCQRSFPQAAIRFFNSLSSTLLGSLGGSLFGAYGHLPQVVKNHDDEVVELCNIQKIESPVINHARSDMNLGCKTKESEEEKDLPSPSSSKYPENFQRFDIVSDCSDHHFLDGAGKDSQLSLVKRSWLKKVQQEWNILEKDLPETIYVRVYEDRMDLLRAAVIGAPGTPYHDGLFFFDIFLPPQYPFEPPMVYYNSGGLRVNPNLYESGKVCLSLLNTWTGSGSEVWDPVSSTILQVLLSLQALVLNEKPYFNEAGYDTQIGKVESEKNSFSYNENAFLVSCKSMLYLLRKPPKHFEALVEEHFSKCGKHILLACKNYMAGAPVGSAFGNENFEQETRNGNSMGFKIMLSKLFPRLVEAFSDKGLDCGHFLNQGE